MLEKKDPTAKDLYFLLGEINGKLDGLLDQQSKTIWGLLALAGATVGLKLVGSPPEQVVLFYAKSVVFLFTVIVSWGRRRVLGGWQYIAGFGVLAGSAQVLNILLPSEPLVGTILFLIANLSLLLFVWNWDHWKKKVPE